MQAPAAEICLPPAAQAAQLATPAPTAPATEKPMAFNLRRQSDPMESLRFMFAVGIECSCPLIGGSQRVDQMRDTGHYELWRTDLKLVRDLGLRYLRYGPPIYRIYTARNTYDWSWLDPV